MVLIVSHLSQIAVILNSITGYTITQYPADQTPEGYYLKPNRGKQAVHDNQETEFFFLVIYGTSLSNLETSITALMNTTSRRPAGYNFTTAGQPSYIDVVKTNKMDNAAEFVAVLMVEGRWAL